MARLSASMASLYAMAVVTWYLAMAAIKIIAYESYFHYLDEDIFEAGLLLPAIAFLAYVIGFTAYQSKKGEWNSGRMVADNDKVCGMDKTTVLPSRRQSHTGRHK